MPVLRISNIKNIIRSIALAILFTALGVTATLHYQDYNSVSSQAERTINSLVGNNLF